jgi:hypothetical protein
MKRIAFASKRSTSFKFTLFLHKAFENLRIHFDPCPFYLLPIFIRFHLIITKRMICFLPLLACLVLGVEGFSRSSRSGSELFFTNDEAAEVSRQRSSYEDQFARFQCQRAPHPPRTPPTWEQVDASCPSTGARLLSLATGLDAATTTARPLEQVSSVDTPRFRENDNSLLLESMTRLVVGAVSGGIAVAPSAYFQYLGHPGAAQQFEMTVLLASAQAAFFVNAYHYVSEEFEDDDTWMSQWVVGVFIVLRTLGEFGGGSLDMLLYRGLESAILFGAASLASDFCSQQGWIRNSAVD